MSKRNSYLSFLSLFKVYLKMYSCKLPKFSKLKIIIKILNITHCTKLQITTTCNMSLKLHHLYFSNRRNETFFCILIAKESCATIIQSVTNERDENSAYYFCKSPPFEQKMD